MLLEKLVKSEIVERIVEQRELNESYEEIVILNKDWKHWVEALSQNLSNPLTHEDLNCENENESNQKLLDFANNSGGLRAGQFLFHKSESGSQTIVLVWPWQDDTHITLKKYIF